MFLGSLHHGAALDRAGNWGNCAVQASRDLRCGHVQDVDWQGHDHFCRQPGNRQVMPLPEGVACYTVAATMAAKLRADRLMDDVIGDGLVSLHSALGQHANPQHNLPFAKTSQ